MGRTYAFSLPRCLANCDDGSVRHISFHFLSTSTRSSGRGGFVEAARTKGEGPNLVVWGLRAERRHGRYRSSTRIAPRFHLLLRNSLHLVKVDREFDFVKSSNDFKVVLTFGALIQNIEIPKPFLFCISVISYLRPALK